MEEDCLSVPDLICGAMGEFLGSATIPNSILAPLPNLSRKSEAILGWMSKRDNLYKLPPIVIEKSLEGTRVRHLTLGEV